MYLENDIRLVFDVICNRWYRMIGVKISTGKSNVYDWRWLVIRGEKEGCRRINEPRTREPSERVLLNTYIRLNCHITVVCTARARIRSSFRARYTSYDMRNNTVCIHASNPLNFDGTAVVFCKQCSVRIVVRARMYRGDNARIRPGRHPSNSEEKTDIPTKKKKMGTK